MITCVMNAFTWPKWAWQPKNFSPRFARQWLGTPLSKFLNPPLISQSWTPTLAISYSFTSCNTQMVTCTVLKYIHIETHRTYYSCLFKSWIVFSCRLITSWHFWLCVCSLHTNTFLGIHANQIFIYSTYWRYTSSEFWSRLSFSRHVAQLLSDKTEPSFCILHVAK